METVRFYFSFRSPYSWLAFHRIDRALAGLPVEVAFVPCFPPKDWAAGGGPNPAKLDYMKADVERIARAYGLAMRWPGSFDCDWLRPHAAFLFAHDRGRGRPFGLGAFAVRFAEGRDLGGDDVLREVARLAGLDGAAAVAAAGDPAWHERVQRGMAGAGDDGLFGVPFFLYRGERFWGNDRIEWLARAIQQASGRPVPDLCADPLARPCG